jgi:hypothetical protein
LSTHPQSKNLEKVQNPVFKVYCQNSGAVNLQGPALRPRIAFMSLDVTNQESLRNIAVSPRGCPHPMGEYVIHNRVTMCFVNCDKFQILKPKGPKDLG